MTLGTAELKVAVPNTSNVSSVTSHRKKSVYLLNYKQKPCFKERTFPVSYSDN
jgi:hypothetical protein